MAVQFKRRWPGMFTRYRALCKSGRLAPGDVHAYRTEGPVVFNMATQDRPGPRARIEWVKDSAKLVAEFAQVHNIDRVAIPRIGCGIGGLEWADVRLALSAAETGMFQFEVWTP